jgi:hypothetical protein
MIAQAEMQKAENQTAELELKAIKLEQDQQKIDFEQQKDQVNLLMDGQQKSIQMQKDTMDMLAQMANILKSIGESAEKDVTLNPDAQKAYDNQAKTITEAQKSV